MWSQSLSQSRCEVSNWVSHDATSVTESVTVWSVTESVTVWNQSPSQSRCEVSHRVSQSPSQCEVSHRVSHGAKSVTESVTVWSVWLMSERSLSQMCDVSSKCFTVDRQNNSEVKWEREGAKQDFWSTFSIRPRWNPHPTLPHPCHRHPA